MIAKSVIIHPNVILGENCVIEDFVIIGSPLVSCHASYVG